jgi:adenosylcobinamide-GDP ribazoletransferase
MLGDAVHDGKVAMAFLTRLPVQPGRPWRNSDLAASVPFFPLAGLVVGLLGGLVFAGATALGLPPLLAAVLAIATLVALTGALHEDGLADLADSLGASGRTRKLEIMRDSRVGSFGVIAIVLALTARIGAIATLDGPALVIAALAAAAALSRALMPVAMLALPQARSDGLAVRAGRPHRARVAAGAAIAILMTLILLPPGTGVAAILAATLAGVLVALLAWRQLGGITGDVLGAVQQLAEIAFLFAVTATM